MTTRSDPRQPRRWDHAVIAVAKAIWRDRWARQEPLDAEAMASTQWRECMDRARHYLDLAGEALRG